MNQIFVIADLIFDLQKIVDADGIAVAVTGMLIVFFALSLISLSIALLPEFLQQLSAILPPETESHVTSVANEASSEETIDNAVVAAIGFVLHSEVEQQR